MYSLKIELYSEKTY